MTIKFLKAYNGDCILISFKDAKGKKRNILIDGGMPSTFINLKNKKGKSEDGELKFFVDSLHEKNGDEKIDLLILTHVDEDHIGGILRWFERDEKALDLIEYVWFNSGRLIKEKLETRSDVDYDNSIEFSDDKSINTSIKQGVKFEDYIESKPNLWKRELIKSGDKFSVLGVEFQILSPNPSTLKSLLKKWEKEEPDSLDTTTKNDYDKTLREHIDLDHNYSEDNSAHNGSSISFILSFKEKNLLLLGDSFASVIVESLKNLGYNAIDKKLKLDLVKLSHHGSQDNNNKELLSLLDCDHYVISTNGDTHCHPHKRLIARLVNLNPKCYVYFNYPELIDDIITSVDRQDYPSLKTLNAEDLKINFEV